MRWLVRQRRLHRASTGWRTTAELLARAGGKSLGALAPRRAHRAAGGPVGAGARGPGTVGGLPRPGAAFGDEDDDAVLDELVGRLGYVEARLVEGEDQERFRRLGGAAACRQRLTKLGWDPAAGETDRDAAAAGGAAASGGRAWRAARSALAEAAAAGGPGAERAAQRRSSRTCWTPRCAW